MAASLMSSAARNWECPKYPRRFDAIARTQYLTSRRSWLPKAWNSLSLHLAMRADFPYRPPASTPQPCAVSHLPQPADPSYFDPNCLTALVVRSRLKSRCQAGCPLTAQVELREGSRMARRSAPSELPVHSMTAVAGLREGESRGSNSVRMLAQQAQELTFHFVRYSRASRRRKNVHSREHRFPQAINSMHRQRPPPNRPVVPRAFAVARRFHSSSEPVPSCVGFRARRRAAGRRNALAIACIPVQASPAH